MGGTQTSFDLSAGMVPSATGDAPGTAPAPAAAPSSPKKPAKKTFDLSAGLVPDTAAAPSTVLSDPTQFRTPAPSAPALLYPNPHSEGTYHLARPGPPGQPAPAVVSVPYSRIADALRSGYTFSTPAERDRFARDYDYGPKGSYEDHELIARALGRQPGSRVAYAARATGQEIRRDISGTPVAGAEKSARRTVGGVLDLTAKWLRSQTSPFAIIDYQRQHPGTTADQARAALSPHAESIQKAADAINAGTALHGPWEEAGGLVEQIGELFLPETAVGKLAEGTRLAGAADLLDVSDISNPLLRIGARAAAEGTKAAAEQGIQQYVHTGGDTEAAKEAGLGGGVLGGAAGILPEIAPEANQFVKNALRQHFSVDEMATEDIIKEANKANQKIDDDLADARERFKADQKKADKAALEFHRQAREANAPVPYAEDTEVKPGLRTAANDARLRRDAVNVKRQNLTDAVARTRQTVQQRLQAIYDASRVYFRKAYGDLQEEAGGGGVDYGTLAEGVQSALQEVKGSAENTRAFKDILARAGRLAQEQEPERATLERLAEMDPDERAAEMDRMREDREPTDASLAELNGYYSELGRVIDSSSTPGDVKAAAQKFRQFIDREIKSELGPELYAKNKAIRGQYRRFAQGFLDYSGPSGSGSPVAAALQAADAYNATRPLIDKPDEVDQRIRDIVVGSARDPENLHTPPKIYERYERQETEPEEGKEPSPPVLVGQGKPTSAALFRRQTLSMIHDLDNMERGLGALPSPEELDRDVEKADRALSEARERARTAEKPGKPIPPERKPYQVLTPEELVRRKADIYRHQAHSLGKFGTWVAIGGIVGGMAGLIGGKGKTVGDRLESGLREGVMGATMGILAPYTISRLLSMPSVSEALTRVTRKDLTLLAALPPAQRAGVEQGIRELAAEAVRSGKMKADAIPWLRVLGGEVGKGVTSTGTTTQAAPTGPLALPAGAPQVMPLPGEAAPQ